MWSFRLNPNAASLDWALGWESSRSTWVKIKGTVNQIWAALMPVAFTVIADSIGVSAGMALLWHSMVISRLLVSAPGVGSICLGTDGVNNCGPAFSEQSSRGATYNLILGRQHRRREEEMEDAMDSCGAVLVSAMKYLADTTGDQKRWWRMWGGLSAPRLALGHGEDCDSGWLDSSAYCFPPLHFPLHWYVLENMN